ncbi:MAG: hypothetical protein AAFR74_00750 [Pseudomonadota bacterium]
MTIVAFIKYSFLAGIATFALIISAPRAQAAPLCHSGSPVTENGLGVAMNDVIKRCLDAVYPRTKRLEARTAMNFQNEARLNMRVSTGLTQFLAGAMEGVDNVATLFGFGTLSGFAEAANIYLTSDSFEQFARRMAASAIGDKLIKDLTGKEQITKDEALKKLYESFTDQLDDTTFNFVTYDSPAELYSDATCGKHAGRFSVRVDPKTRRYRVQSLGLCDCRAAQPVMLHRGLMEGYIQVGKNRDDEVTYRFITDFMSYSGMRCPGTGGYRPKTYVWGQPYSDAPGYSFNDPSWTKPREKTVERLKITRSERGWGEEAETRLKSLAIKEIETLFDNGLEAFPTQKFEFNSGFDLNDVEIGELKPIEGLSEDLEERIE